MPARTADEQRRAVYCMLGALRARHPVIARLAVYPEFPMPAEPMWIPRLSHPEMPCRDDFHWMWDVMPPLFFPWKNQINQWIR